MGRSKIATKLPIKLRGRVEEFLKKHPTAIKKIPSHSVRNLLEDLQVCQIELENVYTELLRVNKKLLENQNRFKQLSELSFEAIAYHKDGILFEANKQFFDMFGYDPDELIGKNALPLTVAPESIELMKKQIRSGSKKTYRAIGLRKNGTEFPMEIRVRETAYRGDTLRVAVIRDITESEQAEKALKESEKRYRAVVESRTEMICCFQPDGTLTFVNEAYCRYFGKNQGELIGKKFMPLIPENDMEVVFKNISSLNPDNPIVTHEHRVFSHSGEIRWNKWTNRAIFDDQNNLMEYQAVGWDITKRKKMEEKLQKARDELEQRVEERTKNLQIKTKELKEMNAAMKVLLQHSEMYKKELEETVLFNIKELVDPYLEKLEGSRSDVKKIYVSIIRSNIDEIISPFARKLSDKYLKLTPSEIRIANLVKQGKTTKEIASILNISGKTVGFHRESIRKKLGLKKKKSNLRSHLLSLQ